MYRVIRSIRVQPGKQEQAVQLAKEIAAYFGRRYGVEMRVLVEVFGDAGTLYWAADFEDLAAVERLIGQTAQDQEYLALINRGNDLVVGGTVHDRVLRHV